MTETTLPARLSLPWRFALGVIFIVAASLGIFYFLMQPPANDLGWMALFLSITAIVSIAAGYAAYRVGWIHRSPTIRWTLLGAYGLSSGLTFLNVWVTARLMFASPHDLLLATVLLLFAGGIAMALGYFFSSAITDRVGQLEQAAHSIAEGRLETRLPVTGKDEVARLAHTFNRMGEKLQAAAREQRQAESLRRDLIAWVSHDLQTPLASIRAILEALADGIVEDPETVQRYLRTAQRDIGALSLLIDDLFQMAQLDAGGLPLQQADNSIADLISDTIESFSELATRQGVRLQGRIAPGTDPVWMDASRIGRVLNNLVGNALRHTPPGGTVEVRAGPAPAKTPDGRPDGVLVEVQDSGAGIPAEDLPHVFERFYRGEKSRNRSTGGAGLGLAISRGIVEAHGGQIGVDSRPEQGTRFYFTLPGRVLPNPNEKI